MKTYNEMAESVFRRRDEYARKKREARKKTVKLSVSFACVTLVLFAGFGLHQKEQISSPLSPEPSKTGEQTLADSAVTGEKDYYEPVKDTPFNNGPCVPSDDEENNSETIIRTDIIDSYEGVGSSGSACYAVPKNGTSFFSIPLNAAFEAYGDTCDETGGRIVYRVAVRVFKDTKMITGKDELIKISEKLHRMGYIPSVEVANGDDSTAVLSLLVTEEALRNFKADKETAYFFFLYNEHDGTGNNRMSDDRVKVIN